jgi:hypothetical protein
MVNNRIKICYAKIEINPFRKIHPSNLRGFLGYLFITDPEFHHHSDSSYHYPLVQYKIIDDKLCVLGLNKYADSVFDNISQLEYLTLVNEKVDVTNVELNIKNFEIKEQYTQYKFTSPWIALNKKNYDLYGNLDQKNKVEFLAKIIIGNILSALKGLNLFLDFKLNAEIKATKSIPVSVNDNVFQGFFAIVNTNILLPDHIGLGKSVSKGFGTLERLQK